MCKFCEGYTMLTSAEPSEKGGLLLEIEMHGNEMVSVVTDYEPATTSSVVLLRSVLKADYCPKCGRKLGDN